MEKWYFVLGIASVIIATAVVLTVWAVLMINKLEQQLKDLERGTADGLQQAHRDCTMVERTIQNGIQHELRSVERNMDNIIQQIDETRRYTDSRIDKMLNDPKFCLNQTKKQQLND